MTDSRLLLTLLAALVPVALFFSLLRRRGKEVPQAEEAAEKPQAEDYGLAREAHEPQAGEEKPGAADGAAAAAAGGALIIGYEVAKARERAAEAEKDRESRPDPWERRQNRARPDGRSFRPPVVANAAGIGCGRLWCSPARCRRERKRPVPPMCGSRGGRRGADHRLRGGGIARPSGRSFRPPIVADAAGCGGGLGRGSARCRPLKKTHPGHHSEHFPASSTRENAPPEGPKASTSLGPEASSGAADP